MIAYARLLPCSPTTLVWMAASFAHGKARLDTEMKLQDVFALALGYGAKERSQWRAAYAAATPSAAPRRECYLIPH